MAVHLMNMREFFTQDSDSFYFSGKVDIKVSYVHHKDFSKKILKIKFSTLNLFCSQTV